MADRDLSSVALSSLFVKGTLELDREGMKVGFASPATTSMRKL